MCKKKNVIQVNVLEVLTDTASVYHLHVFRQNCINHMKTILNAFPITAIHTKCASILFEYRKKKRISVKEAEEVQIKVSQPEI